MGPRALKDVLLAPVRERHRTLASGLALLAEHVQALHSSVEVLRTQDGLRGRPILEAVMGEEAAKVLIVLDAVRGGWRDQKAARQRLGYFYDHFARGMYQRVVAMNPGSFREVRQHVARLRRDLYLDGPNDDDWVFRNEIEASREQAFYVDYVLMEGDHQWVTPSDQFLMARDGLMVGTIGDWPAELTARLVLAMNRIGLLTEAGLDLTAQHWKGVAVSDSTSFGDHRHLTAAVVSALIAEREFAEDAQPDDFGYVADHWPFPLNSLDLAKIPVSSEELEAERIRGEEAFWHRELGPIEY